MAIRDKLVPFNDLFCVIKCDALLFDLDGVLVNSKKCAEFHWLQWARNHQVDETEILRHAHGGRPIEIIHHVAPHLNAGIEASAFEERDALDTFGLERIDGADKIIQSIPDGAYAVVTSTTQRTAITRLTFCGLPIPTILITADAVKSGKPAPEPYLIAAKKLRLAPAQCLVIEDSPIGIQSASSAGMHVVAVTSTYSQADLAKADVIINQLNDIEILSSHDVSLGRFVVRLKPLRNI